MRLQSLGEPFSTASHAALVPNEKSQLAMEAFHGTLAVDVQEAFRPCIHIFESLGELRVGRGDAAGLLSDQVIGDGRGNNEVAVSEPLHECAGTEAIGTVIGEVRLTQDMKSGQVAHEVVVHPEAAHRVVHGWVDAHRLLVSIFAGDSLIHVEKVTVALGDGLLSELLDRLGKIEINTPAAWPHTTSVIAGFLRSTA
jgi:hypothetical protein